MSKTLYALLPVCAFLFGVGIAGCKGSDSKKSSKSNKSAVLVKFEEMEKKACACKDAACAAAQSKEMSKLASKTMLQPTRGEQDKLEAVMKRWGKCIMEASKNKAK